MDPNDTFNSIVRILALEEEREDYRGELVKHLRKLTKWVEKGGLLPDRPYTD